MPEELEEAKEKSEQKAKVLPNIPTGWLILGGVLIAAILYNFYFHDKDIRKAFWYIVVIAAIFYFIAKQKTEVKLMLTSREAIKLSEDYLKWCIRNGNIPDNTRYWVFNWGDLQKIEGKPKYYECAFMLRYMDNLIEFGKAKVDAFSGNVTTQKTAGRMTGREFPEIAIPTYVKKAQKYLFGDKKKGWF